MAVYLGYYRVVPGFMQENQERIRREGPTGPDPKFVQMVRELPDKLPAGCRILGSYAPLGGASGDVSEPGPPSVMIVETDEPRDLASITQYYSGYLAFQWAPATAVGATRQEREAWAATAATPAAAR